MRFLKAIASFDNPDGRRQLQTHLEQIPGFCQAFKIDSRGRNEQRRIY